MGLTIMGRESRAIVGNVYKNMYNKMVTIQRL